MKTAGQILKQTRKKKRLTLNSVAEVTKIRPDYLEALEEDHYPSLPSATSARGFLKNYAEFLGLSSEEVLAVFRRDFSETKVKKFSSQKKITPPRKMKFTWSPKLTTILVVVILAFLFIAYLVWQYFSLLKAPYY